MQAIGSDFAEVGYRFDGARDLHLRRNVRNADLDVFVSTGARHAARSRFLARSQFIRGCIIHLGPELGLDFHISFGEFLLALTR